MLRCLASSTRSRMFEFGHRSTVVEQVGIVGILSGRGKRGRCCIGVDALWSRSCVGGDALGSRSCVGADALGSRSCIGADALGSWSLDAVAHGDRVGWKSSVVTRGCASRVGLRLTMGGALFADLIWDLGLRGTQFSGREIQPASLGWVGDCDECQLCYKRWQALV